MKKTFRIDTFGCQMNIGDSELIRLSMVKNGFIEADDPKNADIFIFNTCSVRENAEKRALSRIRIAGGAGGIRRRLIVVAGCMAQRIGDELVRKGSVHLAAGPYQSPRLGEIISEFLQRRTGGLFISQDKNLFEERLPGDLTNEDVTKPWHRWVTITHGCENYCAYCIVPYVRGRLISFPSKRIIDHISGLASSGIIEVSLLGQNVNQYGQDSGDIPFYKLLDEVSKIEGIVKINFLTSHPMDFSDEIIDTIAGSGNISRSIHLPLQSGSDDILKSMNRKYDMNHYYSIIDRIRNKLPEYALSTDLITGFPGESIEDFRLTLDAIRKIGFDEAFMFSYSPRSGTPSYKMKEELSKEEKAARLEELISVQREISLEKLKLRVNSEEKVIAERVSKKSGTEVSGRTFLNHPVVFTGDSNDIGRESIVEISEVRGSTLYGRKKI